MSPGPAALLDLIGAICLITAQACAFVICLIRAWEAGRRKDEDLAAAWFVALVLISMAKVKP
jgi:hypothetical protein